MKVSAQFPTVDLQLLYVIMSIW